MATESTQFCKRCRKTKDIELFIKNNKLMKRCLTCSEKGLLNKKKNECPHGMSKCFCIICGGTSICIHGRRKFGCVECDGSDLCIHKQIQKRCRYCKGIYICPHNKFKDDCKICGDARKITIRNMYWGSKQHDRKKNRFNPNEFIDLEFLKELVDVSNDKCFYCNCDLQFKEFTGNLATIERLNNNIGHNKGNCVIACRTCNYSRISSIF